MPQIFDVNASPLTTDQIRKATRTLTYIGLALQPLATGAGWLAWNNGCPVFIAMIMIAIIGGLIQMLIEMKLRAYQDVEVNECDALLKACEATPEGQAYRLAVDKQGRKFIDGERSALHARANAADARAAGKRLHGLASESE